MARGAPAFTVAVVGDTLQAVAGALQSLVPCALPYALDPALQPQGWLSGRCRAVREPASGTLWVGVAAAAAPAGSAADAPSQEALKEREGEAARALLAAFLTSHAVLWLASSDRGQVLPRVADILQRLRLLQQLKGALLPGLPALLGVAPSEAGPAVPGFCIPQLLVVAQPPAAKPACGSASVASAAAGAAAAAPPAALPTEAARAAAERQLRLLLKRCRVLLPEDNARALCTLPSAAPAVLCLQERLGSGSQEQLVADALAELALRGTAGQAAQQGQQGRPSAAAVVAAALAPQRAAVAAAADIQTWHSAVTSLAAVLKAAAIKAAGTPSHQPAADVAVPSEAAAAAAWQLACSDGVRQFSVASCKRAAAVASDAYRRNTPDLLPAAGHTVAAAAALRLYRSLARGPAAADGAAALRQQLDDYWRAGHQQCEAVSLLGNPCCLPVHDPQQQPHTSIADAAKPLLLLATGTGGQQQRIPEPFTVAELQQAAAAVAAESASAAARVQFWVRRLSGAGAGASATGAPAVQQAAAAPAEGAALEDEEDAAAGDRRRLSGGGRGSDDEAEAHPAGLEPPAAAGDGGPEASAAAARAAALGSPAAGCWLEMHVLGPRSMYQSAALSAALLMDGQPGWLRAGGCMFAQLPLLVAVPGKPGQQPPPAEQQEAAAPAAEEFPSLAEVKQQEQRRRRPPASAKQRRKEQEAAAADASAEPQQPRLLDWPGWQGAPGAAMAAGSASALTRPGAAGRQPRRQPGQQRGGQQQQQAGTAALAAGTEQHILLLGFEYESVAGQRLLLTPALLAAAVQSSLDTVSVRQYSPAAAAGPGPQTTAAAAAAATMPPTGAAAYLLQHDLPLWLQLPGEQLAQLAGKRRGPAGGTSGSERPTWLQLRRLLVSTPDVAIQLEALPELLVEVPADMLAPPSCAPQQPGSSGSSGSSPATMQLAYRLAAPLALPPASFCVLALPWLLTAPMGQPGGSGSTTAGTPTALIRQSGPLRGVLSAGSALRPAAGSSPP